MLWPRGHAEKIQLPEQGMIAVSVDLGSLREERLAWEGTREGPEPRTIVTKFKRLPVSVAPDQSYLQFVDVEEGLSFPVPSSSELDAYVIYVGFDEMGDKNEKRPPRTAKRPSHLSPWVQSQCARRCAQMALRPG